MSIRATEGGPPWATTGLPAPEPRQPPYKLIALAIVVVVVAAVGVLGATGAIHVPFLGNKTVTEGDPLYGWTLTIPTKWDAKHQAFNTNTTTIRFQSEGSGVGVRVQAQRFPQEVPADQVRSDVVVSSLRKLVNAHGADVVVKDGPTFGTLRAVPYVRYIYTYTDNSSSVPISLEDADYFFFNGAKLEEVTFETTAAHYDKDLSDINTAIGTFHSAHLGPGPSLSPSASGSPSPSPSLSPSASPSPSGSGSPSASPTH